MNTRRRNENDNYSVTDPRKLFQNFRVVYKSLFLKENSKTFRFQKLLETMLKLE